MRTARLVFTASVIVAYDSHSRGTCKPIIWIIQLAVDIAAQLAVTQTITAPIAAIAPNSATSRETNMKSMIRELHPEREKAMACGTIWRVRSARAPKGIRQFGSSNMYTAEMLLKNGKAAGNDIVDDVLFHGVLEARVRQGSGWPCRPRRLPASRPRSRGAFSTCSEPRVSVRPLHEHDPASACAS